MGIRIQEIGGGNSGQQGGGHLDIHQAGSGSGVTGAVAPLLLRWPRTVCHIA